MGSVAIFDIWRALHTLRLLVRHSAGNSRSAAMGYSRAGRALQVVCNIKQLQRPSSLVVLSATLHR